MFPSHDIARVGYDHAIGYLKGGFDAWISAKKPIDKIQSITVNQLHDFLSQDVNTQILDVRKASEYYSQHMTTAINGPLDYINDSMTLIDPNKTYYVHCAGGYRSMVFISILKARGYDNLIDVAGGFSAIVGSGKFDVTEYTCPSIML